MNLLKQLASHVPASTGFFIPVTGRPLTTLQVEPK
jgi:hypothetical protein